LDESTTASPPLPTAALGPITPHLLRALRLVSSTNLTAAIVAASGRPYSVAEVLQLNRDVHFGLFPSPGHPGYEEWTRNKQSALQKARI
jgi:hypothetical protein